MASIDSQPATRGGITIAKTLLTVAFIAAGAWYVGRRFAEFKVLALPSWTAVLVVALGVTAGIFFRAMYNYFTGRRLGAELTLIESFMLASVVTAGNVILPANPGATFRAVYMKRVHGLPYSYFASSMVLYLIVTTLMMSLLCLALLLLIHSRLDYFRADLFLAFPALAAVALVALIWRQHTETGDDRTVWSMFKSAYLELIADRRLVMISIAIVTANFVAASIVWLIVLQEYAPDISALETSLFAASQIASGLINLTPGAAGFQEIVGVYVGRSFALTTVELFAILVWVRLVRTVTAILLGLPCAVLLRVRSS